MTGGRGVLGVERCSMNLLEQSVCLCLRAHTREQTRDQAQDASRIKTLNVFPQITSKDVVL